MLMPAPVLATLTEAQTRSVSARARGSAAMSSSSMREARFSTRAESPPMKSTPTATAAASSARARSSMSSRSARSATQAMGVTAMRRLTMGMPVSAAMASVTATSSPAMVVMRRTTSSGVRQPRRSMPSVTVRMSRWSRPTMPTLSRISSMPSGPRAICFVVLRAAVSLRVRCGAWPRRPSTAAPRCPCRSRDRRARDPRPVRRNRTCRSGPPP